MLTKDQVSLLSDVFYSPKSGSVKCIVEFGMNKEEKAIFYFRDQQELEVFKSGIALAVGYQKMTVNNKSWE
jgi:hypothetical protein